MKKNCASRWLFTKTGIISAIRPQLFNAFCGDVRQSVSDLVSAAAQFCLIFVNFDVGVFFSLSYRAAWLPWKSDPWKCT